MKRYAVWYGNAVTRASVSLMEVQEASVAEFFRNYCYVGVFHAKNLEDLFMTLNADDGQNPLGNPHPDGRVFQPLLMAKVGHTSLSVGDVAVDLDALTAHLCQSFGWGNYESLTRAMKAESVRWPK